MATMNPFDLLGDEDAEDPSQLSAAQKPAPKKPLAQLPSKPLPPAQAVRETKNESGRGGRGGRHGYGRGQEFSEEGEFGRVAERRSYGGDSERRVYGGDSDRRGYGGSRGSFRGGRRSDFSTGEADDGDRTSRRPYERHSGTGRGSELKREGAGRANWGTETDAFALVAEEAVGETEKKSCNENPAREEGAAAENKDFVAEADEKELKDKEMTLEEYEKVREEKRKAWLALKTEERKVDDKEFASMQPLSNKKANQEIFIKLGSDKDRKREAAEKEEKAKKAVSINEFLKPADGDMYYSPGGRGRGRGRGPRGGGYGGGGSFQSTSPAPSIEDPGHFPTLGGK